MVNYFAFFLLARLLLLLYSPFSSVNGMENVKNAFHSLKNFFSSKLSSNPSHSSLTTPLIASQNSSSSSPKGIGGSNSGGGSAKHRFDNGQKYVALKGATDYWHICVPVCAPFGRQTCRFVRITTVKQENAQTQLCLCQWDGERCVPYEGNN
ncbi:hypothetical protein niasHS_017106 [Heterodera schachtii]|uniref:Uncharacterized protein n=1 Tax=Heterodera schachtii TaxID=97005 RepID=A0ABD2I0I6_HETSC